MKDPHRIRYQAQQDWVDDVPFNHYPVGSDEYRVYADEVARLWQEEQRKDFMELAMGGEYP